MRPPYVTDTYLDNFIEQALIEDVGEGDHSTLSTIPANQLSKAKLLIKDHGVMAGLPLASRIFNKLDPEIKMSSFVKDGEHISPGQVAFEVEGRAQALLSAERLVLNCLQRMSGIATYTNSLIQMISHTSTKILDTRKTTPNLRPLEKWAVLIGGGTNHRFALYDMIMLKDNHVDFSGGISAALHSASSYLQTSGKQLKIEIETRSLEEVQEVLSVGIADIIMLDNMSPSIMKAAVGLIDGRAETEASGGITKDTIVEIAETGVDYISVGALTHSVKSLDMSLKAEIDK